jgi:hypothetical protein
MRYLFFAIPILFLGVLAGCVWPPDSTPTGNIQQNFPYNSGYDVHRVSQRSIAGVESVVTTIAPYNEEYYPYNTDSVRYILVNGDTAYRHPILALPPVYDSAVPFHVDGAANFVTLIYYSFSITDTSYENALTAQITSPKYGDTIPRSTDLFIGFQSNSSTTSNSESGYITITDSALSYSLYTDNENTGTLDFPSNDLESFQGNTLWADLYFREVASDNIYAPNSYGNYNEIQREVDVDRIVAYPLH